MKAPCQHCPVRHLGCHSECQKYQEFHNERTAIYAARLKESATVRMHRPVVPYKITGEQ